jgi:hypothetical protein
VVSGRSIWFISLAIVSARDSTNYPSSWTGLDGTLIGRTVSVQGLVLAEELAVVDVCRFGWHSVRFADRDLGRLRD